MDYLSTTTLADAMESYEIHLIGAGVNNITVNDYVNRSIISLEAMYGHEWTKVTLSGFYSTDAARQWHMSMLLQGYTAKTITCYKDVLMKFLVYLNDAYGFKLFQLTSLSAERMIAIKKIVVDEFGGGSCSEECVTLGEAISEYKHYLQMENLSKSTVSRYITNVLTPVRFVYGSHSWQDVPLSNFSMLNQMKWYYDTMLEKGVQRKTLQGYQFSLNRFLSYLNDNYECSLFTLPTFPLEEPTGTSNEEKADQRKWVIKKKFRTRFNRIRHQKFSRGVTLAESMDNYKKYLMRKDIPKRRIAIYMSETKRVLVSIYGYKWQGVLVSEVYSSDRIEEWFNSMLESGLTRNTMLSYRNALRRLFDYLSRRYWRRTVEIPELPKSSQRKFGRIKINKESRNRIEKQRAAEALDEITVGDAISGYKQYLKEKGKWHKAIKRYINELMPSLVFMHGHNWSNVALLNYYSPELISKWHDSMFQSDLEVNAMYAYNDRLGHFILYLRDTYSKYGIDWPLPKLSNEQVQQKKIRDSLAKGRAAKKEKQTIEQEKLLVERDEQLTKKERQLTEKEWLLVQKGRQLVEKEDQLIARERLWAQEKERAKEEKRLIEEEKKKYEDNVVAIREILACHTSVKDDIDLLHVYSSFVEWILDNKIKNGLGCIEIARAFLRIFDANWQEKKFLQFIDFYSKECSIDDDLYMLFNANSIQDMQPFFAFLEQKHLIKDLQKRFVQHHIGETLPDVNADFRLNVKGVTVEDAFVKFKKEPDTYSDIRNRVDRVLTFIYGDKDKRKEIPLTVLESLEDRVVLWYKRCLGLGLSQYTIEAYSRKFEAFLIYVMETYSIYLPPLPDVPED